MKEVDKRHYNICVIKGKCSSYCWSNNVDQISHDSSCANQDRKLKTCCISHNNSLAVLDSIIIVSIVGYGGQAASHIKQMVFNEEMASREIPAGDAGVRMVGPVIMLYGTEEQKQEFLPRIARADIDWAQGYSEPDAGSDLASLQTRAVVDGD